MGWLQTCGGLTVASRAASDPGAGTATTGGWLAIGHDASAVASKAATATTMATRPGLARQIIAAGTRNTCPRVLCQASTPQLPLAGVALLISAFSQRRLSQSCPRLAGCRGTI